MWICADLFLVVRMFVKGYINDQRTQFKRLGVIGEWDKPYITLNHEFEAEQIRVFAEMATKGYIYKSSLTLRTPINRL